MERRTALMVTGATGFLGVALGAFGAHSLKGVLEVNHTREIWSTAVLYHMVHVPVLLWLIRGAAVPAITFLAFTGGMMLFSGSLYALAITGITWLGVVTPVGGLLLMTGWGMIVLSAYRSESEPADECHN